MNEEKHLKCCKDWCDFFTDDGIAELKSVMEKYKRSVKHGKETKPLDENIPKSAGKDFTEYGKETLLNDGKETLPSGKETLPDVGKETLPKRNINKSNIKYIENKENSLNKESKILTCKSENQATDATLSKEKNPPLQLNKIASLKDFDKHKDMLPEEKVAAVNRVRERLHLEQDQTFGLTPEEMNDPKNKLLKYVEAPNELYCTVYAKSAYFDEACGFYLSKDALVDTGIVGYNVQAFGNFARDYKEQTETIEQCQARLIEHFFEYDKVIGEIFESVKQLHNNFFVFLKNYRFNAHKYYDTNKNVHLNEATIKAFKDFYKKYENDKKRPYDAELDLFVSKAYANYKSRDEEYRKNTDFDSFALLFIEKVLVPAYKEMCRRASKAEYLQEMLKFLGNKDSNGFSKFLPKSNPS